MHRKILLPLFIIFFCLNLNAQNFTISGQILDSATGEKMIYCSVYNLESKAGTLTNSYGFFSITLPKGPQTLRFSFVGYKSKSVLIDLDKDINLNLTIVAANTLNEIEISAEKVERIEQTTKMSAVSIPMKQIKSLPMLFGEVDVIKAFQLMPGVRPGTEGSSGLYVRGGSPDQNLILLDGTPVYNVSHLFGFFSVFNADAINSVELTKGGFPARYGGRLSSVLDVNMKEGNMKKFKCEGSIGAIASKIALEGPIIKNRWSYIVTGRRTYIDYLAQPFIRLAGNRSQNQKTGYFFYDLNAKTNFKVNDKNWLYLSFYNGKDKFYDIAKPTQYLYDGNIYESEYRNTLDWGNRTITFRWNKKINSKLFSNFSLYNTVYRLRNEQLQKEIVTDDNGDAAEEKFGAKFHSGIVDYGAKAEFDWSPKVNHSIKYGGNLVYHSFSPGATNYSIKSTFTNSSIDSTVGSKKTNCLENYLFAEDEFNVNVRIKINAGVHYSGFWIKGKYFQSLQPRFSARYLLNKDWALKISYSRMRQYLHLITSSSISLPTDLWVPATPTLIPEISNQIAFGVAKTLKDKYLFTVEGYYKNMNNVIDYKNGASFFNNQDDWESKLTIGKGWSYGVEILAQKKVGRTTGWIGYSLSWTNRKFPDLNNGEKFPFRYDNRHCATFVITHEINKKWKVSADWVYSTGNAVTLATVKYRTHPNSQMNQDYDLGYFGYNTEIETYSKRNGFRMADYHRADISAIRTFKKDKFEYNLSFGVYNIYNRVNPFYYRIGPDNNNKIVVQRVGLLPFLPSVAFNFKF